MNDIAKALEKAHEDVSRFSEKYFPNVTRERRAALAVIEAAAEDYGCDSDCTCTMATALWAWAAAVLGSEEGDDLNR